MREEQKWPKKPKRKRDNNASDMEGGKKKKHGE